MEYLVEIRLKDWVAGPPEIDEKGRIVTYEEVLAGSEVAARYLGFDQFVMRCKYEPVLRRQMTNWRIGTEDCCAPDAVQIS